MDDIYTVIDVLKRFYNVNTIEELVLAQDEHITRLQQEDPRIYPQEYKTKVREGQ